MTHDEQVEEIRRRFCTGDDRLDDVGCLLAAYDAVKEERDRLKTSAHRGACDEKGQ